jgi:hypothetical protein
MRCFEARGWMRGWRDKKDGGVQARTAVFHCRFMLNGCIEWLISGSFMVH